MIDFKTIKQNILDLNATVEPGINWTWANFKKEDEYGEQKAKNLDKWLVGHGLETRGVYPPHLDHGFSVRFRY